MVITFEIYLKLFYVHKRVSQKFYKEFKNFTEEKIMEKIGIYF